eukprot:FR743706.1.p1 GENE.FR743706.1~~FR743706.1.p1  ORF type:complete len:182 (+),score=2.56 FR743706.1:58-546(+)
MRIKRPKWQPRSFVFPLVFTYISVSFGLSSAWVYSQTQQPLCAPLVAVLLHLSIRDTWNTTINIEKRLGVSVVTNALVCAALVAALWFVRNVSPRAFWLLVPNLIWNVYQFANVIGIWRLNEPIQPLFPDPSDNKASPIRWKFLRVLIGDNRDSNNQTSAAI